MESEKDYRLKVILNNSSKKTVLQECYSENLEKNNKINHELIFVEERKDHSTKPSSEDPIVTNEVQDEPITPSHESDIEVCIEEINEPELSNENCFFYIANTLRALLRFISPTILQECFQIPVIAKEIKVEDEPKKENELSKHSGNIQEIEVKKETEKELTKKSSGNNKDVQDKSAEVEQEILAESTKGNSNDGIKPETTLKVKDETKTDIMVSDKVFSSDDESDKGKSHLVDDQLEEVENKKISSDLPNKILKVVQLNSSNKGASTYSRKAKKRLGKIVPRKLKKLTGNHKKKDVRVQSETVEQEVLAHTESNSNKGCEQESTLKIPPIEDSVDKNIDVKVELVETERGKISESGDAAESGDVTKKISKSNEPNKLKTKGDVFIAGCRRVKKRLGKILPRKLKKLSEKFKKKDLEDKSKAVEQVVLTESTEGNSNEGCKQESTLKVTDETKTDIVESEKLFTPGGIKSDKTNSHLVVDVKLEVVESEKISRDSAKKILNKIDQLDSSDKIPPVEEDYVDTNIDVKVKLVETAREIISESGDAADVVQPDEPRLKTKGRYKKKVDEDQLEAVVSEKIPKNSLAYRIQPDHPISETISPVQDVLETRTVLVEKVELVEVECKSSDAPDREVINDKESEYKNYLGNAKRGILKFVNSPQKLKTFLKEKFVSENENEGEEEVEEVEEEEDRPDEDIPPPRMSEDDLRLRVMEFTQFGMNTYVRNFGSNQLKPLDFWTLLHPKDPCFERFRRLIRRYEPSFIPGWLTDVIIDSYLQTIQEEHSDAIIMSSFLLQYIQAGGSAREMISYQNLKNINMVVVPMNRTNDHWTLLVLDKEREKKLFLDPFGEKQRTLHHTMGSMSCDKALFFDIQKLSNALNEALNWDLAEWPVYEPEHPRQLDAHSCGIFTCVFARRLIKGYNVSSGINVVEERIRIAARLLV